MAAKFLLKHTHFSEGEIAQAIAIYRTEIQGGFLGSLGDPVLRLLFEQAARDESSILLLALDAETDNVCGFVWGATSTGLFYKEFFRNHFGTALVHVLPKLVNPLRLWRAVETLLYPTKKNASDLPQAELLVIAVRQAYQGRGVGHLLFRELVTAFERLGIERFMVVAGENLERAQRFYRRLAPVQVSTTEIHRGQRSTIFVYNVREQVARMKTTEQSSALGIVS